MGESREYLDNIKLVDDGVERMEEVIEEFFDYDGKTVYVFTSDHGMTDWGNSKLHFIYWQNN
jgi:GPI ethanolamine phosphate transferase 1